MYLGASMHFFSGSSHVSLAQEICSLLFLPLGNLRLNRFPDGEIWVEIQENVKDSDVFVLQSMAEKPNDYLCELLMIVDALKRASAKSITVIIPYLAYCRQDRLDKPGVPITAKLIANLLTVAGVDHLITCDLHSDQIEGFFEIPVKHLRCQSLLLNALKKIDDRPFLVVAPDIGSVKTAEKVAKQLEADLVIIKKRREENFHVSMHLIGNVDQADVVIVDDLCATGETLVSAAQLCKQKGAGTIYSIVTHGVFVGNAFSLIKQSPIDLLLTTNSAIYAPDALKLNKIKMVSLAPMLAELIKSVRP